jgi:uncharacterized protein
MQQLLAFSSLVGYFSSMHKRSLYNGFLPRIFSVFALALLCALPSLPVTARAGIDEATTAFSTGHFVDALKEFRGLADGGSREAEFMLGVMYFQGRGVGQNHATAAIWFHKSALKGHAGAQLAFGSIHIRGVGVYQDLHQAIKWLSLAATSRSPEIRLNATNLIQEAARLMTPGEIDAARISATDFSPIKSGLTSQ